MLADMKGEESSDAPFDVRLCPSINPLAMISFVIAIGAILGGIYILYEGHGIFVPFILILIVSSVFGALSGHRACKQIRARRPHEKGTAMAVIGIIGCYVSIGWCFLVFFLLGQTV
jgi:uncharacterized membrane protein YfcA